MTFLAPAWIALAAGAALAVVAIHLIAWRLPRTVALPTARFVPNEPARLAARAIRPSDFVLLALRVAIILAGGLALAKPRLGVAPSGSGTVIAIDGSIGDTAAIRDSLRGIPDTDVTRFVVFDTAVQVLSDEASAVRAIVSDDDSTKTSLTVGLLAAIREAKLLRRNYESVRVVLVSSLARGQFDQATEGVRATWSDSIRIVRIPVAARDVQPAHVEFDVTADDPVVAGIRLAHSHGLLEGSSRVVRGSPTASDSTFASSGKTLVLWPRLRENAVESVDAVHAGDATAIGHFRRSPAVSDSGRVIARWVDGDPAAHETMLGTGCVRTIAFDVSDPGDFVLTTSFQRLVSVLVAPCGQQFDREVAADSVVEALVAPSAGRSTTRLPDESGGPNRLAALLMALAILLAIAEMTLRRGVRTAPVEHAA